MQISRRESTKSRVRGILVGLALLLFLAAVAIFQPGYEDSSSLWTVQVAQEDVKETSTTGRLSIPNNHDSPIDDDDDSVNVDDDDDVKARLDDRLVRDKIWTDLVWENLIQEAAAHNHSIAMEVGVHSPKQCLQAAKAGLEAHCVEPSPQSFARIQTGLAKQPQEIQQRVHLYNMAASNTSQGTVPFLASGGTGDHVGEFDMWNMQAGRSKDQKGNPKMVQVPQVALDAIVKDIGNVFLLKVDTQGFEPTVFAGLTESLREHKIQYIVFEYWPRGMDLLAGEPDACIGAELLQDLVDAGYTLYALPVLAHPAAPKGYKSVVSDRPLDNLHTNCQWYLDLEQRFPSENYKMGYWSDVLAVAPNARLEAPTTRVGKLLAQS